VSDYIPGSERVDYINTGDKAVIPALGLAWSNCVNLRLLLRKVTGVHAKTSTVPVTGSRRAMHVVLAPHIPNQSVDYFICEQGVRGIADPE
jgi:DNA-repair protein XRCC3